MFPPFVFPAIDPGNFRHLLTFLNQTTGADASGSSIVYAASVPPQTAWGQIRPVRGTDKLAAGQDVAQNYVTITLWWAPWIATTMRVQAPSGSIYIIQAIENVLEMNVLAVLTCLGLGANT